MANKNMSKQETFFNLYHHNFIRATVAVPELRVADPSFNAQKTRDLLGQAADQHSLLVAFPELGLSAYSCDDLFQQQALLAECQQGLRQILNYSKQLPLIGIVGLPLQVEHLLFNCAVVFYRGRLLGVVPKTYVPNYREFYELRQFAPADYALRECIDLCDQKEVPFGSYLLFQVAEQPLLTFHVEICEDLRSPIPPSSYAALAGATVIINLSASNITVGKDDYRRLLANSQSSRCLAAYLYTAAGTGESTTDLAWDGHGMVYENGDCLAETERFSYTSQLASADIDLDRLQQDRMRQNSFGQSRARHRDRLTAFRTIRFSAPLPAQESVLLKRIYERFPYVPSDPINRDRRCQEVYDIQIQGLVKRLQAAHTDKVVIGISGGLDSTQALIICARAMDSMKLPRRHVLAYTMPGFATSERTLNQARQLMAAVGCQAHEIDIRPSCLQMLKDLGHPYAQGEPVYDVTFENVQAGERTSHLFRLANFHSALVVGTGDLSELALGWCTYGVGDHMSHYHVNASVPKTLIQYLIGWVARNQSLSPEASAILEEIRATDISPELVPHKSKEQPGQRSEEVIGPYELQDFHLYYLLRFGYDPTKVAFLAWSAWHDRTCGAWPGIPETQRNQYPLADIKRWLGVFLKRFFQSSQFKRSCVPNGPKVGSGGSLSPRGDYRAPSDSEATAWLTQLERIPDGEPPWDS
ncbi:NAD(+) synthase [Nitrosococcus watsonii]|uniref:Glutamine-dependent NAD(+) synthetase n=1 Tax=Nitrosococcus watsoni (strain C-113) TaxID=105559 RepID=D8K4V8_NITWC|nr:NAD(+) synthase [Nitrosococcus watsonii]ADJ27935.1 NAD+ synthetase [Nitrosococcus watsonii C-113]